MGLPDVIEIVPLTEPVHAEITVPGSKSITNRALVLAALADGEVTLNGALWSEDTQVMVECLQELGFMVNVAPDPAETCNRTITVYGQGGQVPRGGTIGQPMELFVGNAGTAARFLAALVCLGEGVYRLHGVPRMHERPQAALFQALRELGYRIDSLNDKLPALIFGNSRSRGNEALNSRPRTPDPGPEINQSLLTSAPTRACRVSIEESSQFASALLLAGRVGQWQIEITGENAEESPYVRMTSELIKVFPHHGGEFQIEPDASSGSYFWAIGYLLKQENIGLEPSIIVERWPDSGMQIDSDFHRFLPPPIRVSRIEDLGDSMMTAIVLAPFVTRNETPVVDGVSSSGDNLVIVESAGTIATDLSRLRYQECDRVTALRIELTKCGAKVIEEGDTLTVFPSKLHGAEIETYDDHRMAMCFGVLGLKVPGMKIRNPACVKKTFPNFWQKLATAPPHGLGATILDAKTGKKLSHDELFAD